MQLSGVCVVRWGGGAGKDYKNRRGKGLKKARNKTGLQKICDTKVNETIWKEEEEPSRGGDGLWEKTAGRKK